MARLRLFGPVRQAAGTGVDQVSGSSVAEVLAEASQRYGPDFTELLASCRIWVNGEPADDATAVADGDEVAVLPPVSGG